MSDRPILYTGPNVIAMLEGRKTQTRRAISAPTARGSFVLSFNLGVPEFNFGPDDRKPDGDLRWHRCPYGQPGDLLWVRETCCPDWADKPVYKADGGSAREAGYPAEPRWRPSIHMPRWASRLTLRITDVRVQRLQDICRDDAIAEGTDFQKCPTRQTQTSIDAQAAARSIGMCAHYTAEIDYVGGYQWLWESINGPGSWDANPWVWALTFEVIKTNVDQVKP